MGRRELGSGEIRRIAASALVALGVLLALLAGVFRYVDQQFHSPATFVETSATLRDNADVRERIFAGFRDEIIRLADGEDETEPGTETAGDGAGSIIPAPRSQILADDDQPAPLSGSSTEDDEESEEGSDFDSPDPVTDARIERDQAIEEILLNTLDSDLYDEVFVDALKLTQPQIIRTAELEDTELLRDSGEITFDLRRLYPSIYQQLAADERTAFITQKELPAEFGIFPVADRETTVNLVWSFIRGGPGWRSLTYAGAIMSLIAAVVIADRRPSTAIQFGGGMVGSAAVALVVIYIIRAVVPLLAGGGASAGPVVAVYATTIWPLVRIMLWIVALGAVLSFLGWIARLIWPDDWVYSHVSDDRGIRSIKRWRGEPDQQQPAAAATPVQYPGYGQPPYVGYPGAWGQMYPGQPYAGQPYPPPGAYPYPAGPYAQPAIPAAPYVPGRPTVPVTPVVVNAPEEVAGDAADAAEIVAVADLPGDAAQPVPRVVSSVDNGAAESAETDETDDSEPDDWSAEHDW